MVHSRQIGARVKRKEDPRLVTGSSTYVDDLRPARTVHMAILRSVYAHARISRVDIDAARAHPGVIAAYTGEQLRALCGPLPAREGEAMPGMSGFTPPLVWPVAADRVRFVGQPVAVVVAADRYIARDALDLIDGRLRRRCRPWPIRRRRSRRARRSSTTRCRTMSPTPGGTRRATRTRPSPRRMSSWSSG